MAYLSQLGQPQYPFSTEPVSTLLDPAELAAWRTRQSVMSARRRQEPGPLPTLRSLAAKAAEPITSYPETYRDMNREARVQMAEGIDQLSSPQGAWDVVKGAGNLSLGTLGWVGSPISAAFRTVAGKPIEENTGIPKEYTEFALSMAPMMPKRGLPVSASRPVTRAAGATGDGEIVPIFNPPAQPPRPFAADYPAGAKADSAGRLLTDIEGRPLVAERVVGRRVLGATDEALPPTEFDSLATKTVGQPAKIRSAEDMEDAFGVTHLEPGTLRPSTVDLRSGMRPDQEEMVYGHELGHVIDGLAKWIDTNGLMGELKRIYNTLNNPRRSRDGSDAASSAKPFTPEDLQYEGGWQIAREYMAEAIRAYLADPNYIKTIAPQTAARIREYVNAHPELSKIIQFNSVAALPIGVAATSESAEARGAEKTTGSESSE